jgi:hypothetical protein
VRLNKLSVENSVKRKGKSKKQKNVIGEQVVDNRITTRSGRSIRKPEKMT